ncbi:MAG: hypothetical protein J6T16_04595 [Opitutales bacterium]|nr:hypothetical protein [Opitutales bacterium]
MRKLIYFCLLSCALSSALPLFAKVGETRVEIERRMDSRLNGAYKYPLEDSLREAMELPYKHLILMQPAGNKNAFYFKRPDTSRTEMGDTYSQNDLQGWEVHYTYLDDVSVMEFYRRQGQPMTYEELEALMKAQISKREGVHWMRVNYVPQFRKYSVEFDDAGNPRGVFYGADGKRLPSSKDEKVELSDILPKNNDRFIFVELRPEVLKDRDFLHTVQGLIYTDIEMSASETNTKRVEDDKSRRDARTKRGGSSNKKGSTQSVKNANASDNVRKMVYPFGNSNIYKTVEPNMFDFKIENPKGFSLYRLGLEDVFYGGRAPSNRTPNFQMTCGIPLQPNTSVGYSYELSDGAVRAMVFKDAVMFIDASYDKKMRAYMEKLYEKQSEIRKENAEKSIDKF